MYQINLLTLNEFEPYTDFEIKGEYVDLHNSFDCYSLRYATDEFLELILRQNKSNEGRFSEVKIIFNDIDEFQSKYPLESTNKAITLDLLIRTGYTSKSLYKKRGIPFQISFIEGQDLNFTCKEAKLILE